VFDTTYCFSDIIFIISGVLTTVTGYDPEITVAIEIRILDNPYINTWAPSPSPFGVHVLLLHPPPLVDF
jgi:hypothetical protein